MSRCNICDYLDGYGSELTDKAPRSGNRVKWHSNHGMFICSDCYSEHHGLMDYYYWKHIEKSAVVPSNPFNTYKK